MKWLPTFKNDNQCAKFKSSFDDVDEDNDDGGGGKNRIPTQILFSLISFGSWMVIRNSMFVKQQQEKKLRERELYG